MYININLGSLGVARRFILAKGTAPKWGCFLFFYLILNKMPFTKLIPITRMVLFSHLGLTACGSQQDSKVENTAFLAFYVCRLHCLLTSSRELSKFELTHFCLWH